MPLLYTLESLLYYFLILIVGVKIYDTTIKKSMLLFSLVYIPIIVLSLIMVYEQFMIAFLLVIILDIIFLKLALPQIRISSLIYTYTLMFTISAITTSTALVFIDVDSYIIEAIVHIIMAIVFIFICFTNLKHNINIIRLWTPINIKRLVIILMIFNMLVIVLMADINNYANDVEWIFWTHRFLVLLVIFVCSMLPVLISHSVSNTYLKKLTTNYENQILAQADHYSALARSNLELRRFRHDFKNLQIGLNELLGDGHVGEAIDMINNCNASLMNATDSILKFDTGNGIVDALLADKQQAVKASNINIEFSGAVPDQGIAPTDLCVLFGNTIDNAIEACQKLPEELEKTIRIDCKCAAGFMFIDISNPVVENVKIKNNTLSTTKSDKSLHGFGLYSLDRIVTNHNGELSLSCENNCFEVSINMSVA